MFLRILRPGRPILQFPSHDSSCLATALAYGGVPFEDLHVPYEEWPALKASGALPFDGLPVLVVDGVEVSQVPLQALPVAALTQSDLSGRQQCGARTHVPPPPPTPLTLAAVQGAGSCPRVSHHVPSRAWVLDARGLPRLHVSMTFAVGGNPPVRRHLDGTDAHRPPPPPPLRASAVGCGGLQLQPSDAHVEAGPRGEAPGEGGDGLWHWARYPALAVHKAHQVCVSLERQECNGGMHVCMGVNACACGPCVLLWC